MNIISNLRISMFGFFLTYSNTLAASFSPSQSSGRVSAQITENQINGFLNAGVNAGLFDQPLTAALLDLKEQGVITQVLSSRFSNAKIELHPGYMSQKASVDFGVYRPGIGVSVRNLNLTTTGHFRYTPNLGASSMGVDYCIDATDLGVSSTTFSFVPQVLDGLTSWLAQKLVDDMVDPAVDKARKETGCIPLLDNMSIGFPLFGENVSLQRLDLRTIEDALEVSACPVPVKMIGVTSVIENNPCEQWRYIVTAYTGKWQYSGTSAKVYAKVCGKVFDGSMQCLDSIALPPTTENEQTASSATIDSDVRLLDSVTVKIWHNNSGSHPGWYLDSASLNVLHPDNTSKLYWLPTHRWCSKNSVA